MLLFAEDICLNTHFGDHCHKMFKFLIGISNNPKNKTRKKIAKGI